MREQVMGHVSRICQKLYYPETREDGKVERFPFPFGVKLILIPLSAPCCVHYALIIIKATLINNKNVYGGAAK